MTTEEKFKAWLATISISTINKGSIHCIDRFISERKIADTTELRSALRKIFFDYQTPRISL